MYTNSLNYCAFCEDLDPFVALATLIDMTLELLGCSVFMNPQKSRFYVKQRFISDLPIARDYFQVSKKKSLKTLISV